MTTPFTCNSPEWWAQIHWGSAGAHWACLSVHSSSSSQRLKAGPFQSSQPALPPVPPDPGKEALSPTMWWRRALTGTAWLYLKEMQQASPVEFWTIERPCMFSLGQVFLTSFVMSTIPISCGCVENCFVMKDLHWGIEQHLIKSMFVFCLCCLCFFQL